MGKPFVLVSTIPSASIRDRTSEQRSCRVVSGRRDPAVRRLASMLSALKRQDYLHAERTVVSLGIEDES